jgi:hypothetical protein
MSTNATYVSREYLVVDIMNPRPRGIGPFATWRKLATLDRLFDLLPSLGVWPHDAGSTSIQSGRNERRFGRGDTNNRDSLSLTVVINGLNDIGKRGWRKWNMFSVDESPVISRQCAGIKIQEEVSYFVHHAILKPVAFCEKKDSLHFLCRIYSGKRNGNAKQLLACLDGCAQIARLQGKMLQQADP